jgi:LytS/YehU family sensor histidine kinase
VLGEALRVGLDPFSDRTDTPAILGRIVQWTLIGAVCAGILAFWRLSADLATVAADEGAADARVRRMLLTAELEGLQRQIEPHFLFNTLATIKRFGESAPEDARALLERLFDYLSGIFAASPDQSSSLGAELDLVTAYLDVCAVRMGARLTVVNGIDPRLRACSLPPLMLGTLVENAVRHGLAPSPNGGTIALSARVSGANLEIRVEDDGAGLSTESGAGMGLANLASRLRLLYGRRASLRLEAGSDRGVRAVLSLPYALDRSAAA